MYGNFLAPIDGYTDLPFRLLCSEFGAAACCVPLVNAEAIVRGKKIVDAHPEEDNVGVQLVGSNPETIGKACQVIIDEKPFIKWLNLNCGCPSSRTMECGGGSALLKTPKIIMESIAKMKRYGLPVSVKIRASRNTVKLCKDMEKHGADFIIIHGRTPGQGYSGKNNWDMIKKVKESIGIPVVGNGDITMAKQGMEYVENGYCDSFMVGRAAMFNPMIFSDRTPTKQDRIGLLEHYLRLHKDYIGEPAIRDVRLKAIQFISGITGASALRDRITKAKTSDEIRENIKSI